jgi:hypothetical protein
LRDFPDVPAAFAAYEQLRRARVERLVATSAGESTDADRTWLYDHHIDWDATITT